MKLPKRSFFIILLACFGILLTGGAAADSLSLPDELLILEEEAFAGDTSLDEVMLPDSLAEIKSRAFADSSVTKVVFPDHLASIAEDAFDGCTQVTGYGKPGIYAEKYCLEHRIPYVYPLTPLNEFTFTFISDSEAALTGWTGTGDAVSVPDMADETHRVTAIGKAAFINRTDLRYLHLPSFLTEIGEEAFRGCSGLVSVHIPDSVTVFRKGCFRACTGLISVELPGELVTLEQDAFRSCAVLEDVVFNQKLKEVGCGAFADCVSLIDADLPDSVETFTHGSSNNIGVFRGDISLVSFRYPAGLKSCYGFGLNDGHFSGCVSLTEITVPEGITFIPDYLFMNAQSLTQVHLPSTLTEIGEEAFRGCSGLSSINIPDSVTVFRKGCFRACTGLVSVELPGELVTLEQDAFRDCAALEDVVFNQKLKEICCGAFADCVSLIDADLPDSVETFTRGSSNNIGIFRGDISLISFRYPAGLATCQDFDIYNVGHFDGCVSLTEITVPEGIVFIPNRLFMNAQSLTQVHLPSTLTEIGEEAFRGCSGLSSISIPDSVTVLRKGCFQSCTGLASVELPGELVTLEQDAFRSCAALEDVMFNQKLKEVGCGAFADCVSLIDADLPDSVEAFIRGKSGNIGVFRGDTSLVSFRYPAGLRSCFGFGLTDGHFFGCEKLKEVRIPEGITEIPAYLFKGSQYLERVFLPSTLTGIGAEAFRDCAVLQSPAIPDSLTVIGQYAFSGCSGLDEMELPAGFTELGNAAFKQCAALRRIYIPSAAVSLGTELFLGTASDFEIWTEYGAEAVSYAVRNNHAYYYLSLVDAHLPETVYLGRNFNLYGSVKSTVPITVVTAELRNAAGDMLHSITVHPGTTSFNLSGAVCSEMDFAHLATGKYTIEISGATAKSSEIFVRKTFSVKEAPFAPKLTGYNFHSGALQAFTTDGIVSRPMEGTITANYPITGVLLRIVEEDGTVRQYDAAPNDTVYHLADLGFNENMLPLGHYTFTLSAEGHGESVILDESRLWFDSMDSSGFAGVVNPTRLNEFINNKKNRQYFFINWSEVDLLKDEMLEAWATSDLRFLEALKVALAYRGNVKQAVLTNLLHVNFPHDKEGMYLIIAKEQIRSMISNMSQSELSDIDYDGSISEAVADAFNNGFRLGSALFPNYPGDLPDWLSGLIDIYNGAYDSEPAKFEELNASYPSIGYVIGSCMAEYQKGMAVLDLLDSSLSTNAEYAVYFHKAVVSLKDEYTHNVRTAFLSLIKEAYSLLKSSADGIQSLHDFLTEKIFEIDFSTVSLVIDVIDSAGAFDSSREFVKFLVLMDAYQASQMNFQKIFDTVSNGDMSDSAVSLMTTSFRFTQKCGVDALSQALKIKETYDPSYLSGISHERIYDLWISFRDLRCPYLD